jgi:hypothetical protein
LAKLLYEWRATGVLIVCVILSIGGIVIAGQPSDAGRGGALAVALSLVILFFSESPGMRTFSLLTIDAVELKNRIKRLDDTPKIEPSDKTVDDQLKHIETRLDDVCKAFIGSHKINERALFWNNFQMALGSAVGTLAWGFGDFFVTVPTP